MNEVMSFAEVRPELETEKFKERCTLTKVGDKDAVATYKLSITGEAYFVPTPVVVKWKLPAVNVRGVWRNSVDLEKRIQPDWELDNQESRISIDSPVISLFGYNDQNIITFACSNAVNRVELAAKYREEDNHFYCQVIFFTECKYQIREFETYIRLDFRNLHFSESLNSTAQWWQEFDMSPLPVPDIARKPLYSTWYQFHQALDVDLLKSECTLAKALGFDAIIIDDGWQTNDSNRGYDYTGDWEPERITNMAHFVKELQDIGMKVGLWFSVPFCGIKSKAYKRFKGKFLTENHRWAPVFDPRFPEVREYLVGIYTHAVQCWGLDGLKLDFIDDFRSYEDTNFGDDSGRDGESINDAVNLLLSEITSAVGKINPGIFIEFRQKYTGPAIRKYGNMLRAFDCPGDATMNRIRIADLRLLSGETAVHSDMVTWHFAEPPELAAIHVINTLFAVPQLSILLTQAPADHLEMVKFYMDYWLKKRKTLLDGHFRPHRPLANYPVLEARDDHHHIFGVFDEYHLEIDAQAMHIDILNGKMSEMITLFAKRNCGEYHFAVYNCRGEKTASDFIKLEPGFHWWKVPGGGMITFDSVKTK